MLQVLHHFCDHEGYVPALCCNVDTELQMCLPRAVQWGRITSLDPLAMLLLAQPKKPVSSSATRAHCWLMFSSAPTRIPRSCSADAQPPACAGGWGCSSPGAGLCTSPSWTVWGSWQPSAPACWGHSLRQLVWRWLQEFLGETMTCNDSPILWKVENVILWESFSVPQTVKCLIKCLLTKGGLKN